MAGIGRSGSAQSVTCGFATSRQSWPASTNRVARPIRWAGRATAACRPECPMWKRTAAPVFGHTGVGMPSFQPPQPPPPMHQPPRNFQGAPSIQTQRVGQQAARVVDTREPAALPRSVAQLTVYADGRVRPSSEAVELFGEAAGICFYPPPAVRPGCTPQLWQVSPGECHPFRVAGHGGHIQLRAAGKCPPAGRYLFTPVAGKPTQYALVPTG